MKQTMKHSLFHWCRVVCLLLLFAPSALRAQYSNEAAQTKKLSELYDQRGYMNGQSITVDGSLAVSDVNGIPSYTYPISSFTSNGHGVNVTLNYAGSVTYTTYHRYYEFSENNPNESWSKYHKTEPTWLLGVNGFAVQALSFSSTFVNDPYYMTINWSDNNIEYTDKQFVWSIDGYDVCNRMSELVPTSDNLDRRDVIRLLRTDGSVLELYNIVNTDDLPPSENPSFYADMYRGYYYENTANPSAYGKVEFDSTYIPPNSTLVDPSRMPRILRYYPGDGLEYVFREFCLPFGKETYTAYSTNGAGGQAIYGAVKAPPTIFYLDQINDETENVLSFEYARHKPSEQMLLHPSAGDQDVSRGRALCTGFTGHTLIYNSNALSIQALGRTTNIRFATAAGGSAYRDTTALDATSDSPIIVYGEDGAPAPTLNSLVSSGLHNWWKGYITSITDPEGRQTQFTYEKYTRIFRTIGFPHKFTANDQRPVKLAFWRMKTVTEPTVEQRISYHGATDTTITASGGFMNPQSAGTQEKLALKYSLNATVKNVKKYNLQNTLLTTRTYDMQPHGSIPSTLDFHISNYRDGWLSQVSQTDNSTGQSTWETQDYHVYEFPTHESRQWIPFSQLYARETQADNEYTYTETHYRKLDTMLIQPYKSFTKVKNGYGGTFLMQSATRYEYDTVTVRPYPDVLSRRYLGREIAQRRSRTLNPSDTSQTLLITKSNYLHIAQLDTVFTARSRQWNKQKAFAEFQRMLPQLVQNGDSTMWAEVMASIMAYDTIETNTLRRMPALYNLETRSVVTDAAGTILSGEAKRYATSYKQDDTSSIYRGALLSDSLIGYGGVSMFQTAYTYWGGRTGYHRALLRTETDAAGAVTRYEYDYAQGTSGLMFCNDNSTKSATLFGRRGIGEYESPLGTIHYNRTFSLGGIPQTTVLADAVERTYHDQVSASVDENGIYTRFDYDKNGRMRTAWLPKDFPGDSLYTEPWTGELEVPMPGFTRYTHRVDTIICSPPPGTPPNAIYKMSPLYSDPDYLRLIAAKLPDNYPCGGGSISIPMVSSSGSGKTESPLSTASTPRPYDAERLKRGYFTAAASRPIREAINLSKAKLRLHITKILGNCVNFTVRIMRPATAHLPEQLPTYSDTLLVRTYVLNCSGVWSAPQNGTALPSGDGSSSKYETPNPLSGGSTSPLPYQLLTVDMNSIANDLLSGAWEVEISTTTMGGEVEVVNDGSDWQPTLIIEGSFNRVHELADYSMRYNIADRWADPMEATVWTKLDDSLHTANAIGLGSTPVDNSRYTLVKNRFGADYRILTGLETKTKNGVTWTDSVLTRYTGIGQTLRITDQLGDTASTVYDAQGRVRYSYSADGTRKETRYAFGSPSSLISGNDQDFYGLCRRVLSIEEDGNVSAKFYDAFGRLRLELFMGLSPHDTNTNYGGTFRTKYEYDLLGRLSTVVNPEGDTSRYWYDTFGRIKYKYQPDMGYTSYAYDKLGNTRFVQTQAQADSIVVTFQEYDDLGRRTLIGEARLGGEPGGGGGHGLSEPKGKTEGTLGFPSHPVVNLNRLTDQLDPNILHDNNTSGMLTANKTVQLGWLVPLPSFWTSNELEQTLCRPIPPLPQQPVGQLLRHPVAYYNDPGLPLATVADFEHISRYPQNARTVVHYDEMPKSGGSVWFYFPSQSQWDALAPTGRVRNQRDREAAVAYRTHAGEPYHFTVMSYDERGRVEAVLHYTENLGFDAVYYTYNSLNLPVSIRVADPQRQYTTWYGYNSNGRTDSVWTLLSSVGSGLGVANPSYRPLPAKPAQPDVVYDYTKRWQTKTMAYPPVNTVVSYNYNAHRFLDSMIVLQNGSTRLFTQKLRYNTNGQITRQTTRHNTQGSDQVQAYAYNFDGRLMKWGRDTTVWGANGEAFYYDDVGNRLYTIDYDNAWATRLYSYPDPVSKNRLMNVALYDPMQIDTTKFLYTSDGSVRYRERRTGNGLKQENFTYDNIQGRVKRYTCWDGSIGGFGQNQDWHYRYNASGTREQKRLYETAYSKTWTYYLLGGDGKQLAVYKGIEAATNTCGSGTSSVYMSAAEYLTYAADEIHTMTTRPVDDLNGVKEYKVQDPLGNTRLVIAQGGSVTCRLDYKPFGGILWQSGTAPRLTWIDREEDAESSLGDFGARKYDDELGRFLSVDPRWEEQPSLSPYHYAANNPVTNKDADGEIFDTILDVAFIAADVIDIGVSIAQGKGVSTEQVVSLTANVVCLAIPGATGGGAIARAVMKADKAADVIKTGIKAEKALVNTGKTVKAVDKTADVSKTVKTTSKTTNKIEKTTKATKSTGRTGKQQRLKELAKDDKVSSADRGWIKQEQNSIKKGKRTIIRVPPGKQLAHRRGKAAKDGHGYEHSDLQNPDLHKLQHKYEGK